MGQALSIALPVIAVAGTIWFATQRPKRRLCPPQLRPRVRYTRLRAPEPDRPETPCRVSMEPAISPIVVTGSPVVTVDDSGDDDVGTVTGFVTRQPAAPVPDDDDDEDSPDSVRAPPSLAELAAADVTEFSDFAIISPTPSEAAAVVGEADDYEWDEAWEDWTSVHDVPTNVLAEKMPDFDRYYHIGFVGAQGSGKTSLCNVMRAAIEHVRQSGDEATVTLDQAALRKIVMLAVRDGDDDVGAEDDDRDATPHTMGNLVLWDLGGAGTQRIPAAECVRRSGLAFMSTVVVVVGLHDTEATAEMVATLHALRIPFVMVQTHMDQYIRTEMTRECIVHQAFLKYGPADVDFLLQSRRDYLRDKYALEDRDQVMCVNTLPWIFDTQAEVDRIAADTYDLADCVLYTLRAAQAAHQP